MYKRTGLLILLVAWAAVAGAQNPAAEEAARQTAFRQAMEHVVTDINDQRFATFAAAIDREAMVQRIFGLRLIDQTIKKSFVENLDYQWGQYIAAQLGDPKKGDLKVTLLGVESRGNQGRAVLRFDLPKQQFNYHEYQLMLDENGRMFIVDWIDYLDGAVFSEREGNWMVSAMASDPAMRKLLDYPTPSSQELFQFRELLKSARDRRLDRYLEILEDLPDRLKRQRIVVETTVRLSRDLRQRRPMLAGLQTMAGLYPTEPLYALMLLDHFFPQKQFDAAKTALSGAYGKIGFDDAAMEARLSATELVLGDAEAAARHADRALELEKGLELGWWSALAARVALRDHAGSVEALEVLAAEFGYDLGPAALSRSKSYQNLVDSAEYKVWAGANSTD